MPCRYTVRDRLRDSRAREAGTTLSPSLAVRLPYPSSPLCSLSISIARDPRFERLPCSHVGTYADDCLVQRATANRCFIVATCDRELRRRIRKIPGVPLMYIVRRRYAIERLPDQGTPV
jgi:hypothetical protein